MKSKCVAILETRTGEHLAELVSRRGGVPLWAPALEEVPDLDPERVASLVRDWTAAPFGAVIFQTGVGTRALFAETDRLGISEELCSHLASACVIVRGPKPVGELNTRRVRIDLRAASPFTTDAVLLAMAELDVGGMRILVQRYGAANEQLTRALAARGAVVDELTTYRWSLPRDTGPLEKLLDALDERSVAAVVFTSAVQIHNLYAVARTLGRSHTLGELLAGTIVASIGPVCSAALTSYGIRPSFEASPPKLGPMLAALEAALVD